MVLHGPNLNLLGAREPGIYGRATLADIDRMLAELARRRGATIECRQSNIEGELVTYIQEAAGLAQAILINPAAYTHTSVAIADALRAVGLPAVEVHLSDVGAREEWRRQSVIRDLCVASVVGKGVEGYREALTRLRQELEP